MTAARTKRPGALARLGLVVEALVVVVAFGALVDLGGRLFGLEPPYTAGRFLGFAVVVSLLTVLGCGLGLRARGENFVDLGLSRERYAPALALLLGVGAGLLIAALGFAYEVGLELAGLPAPALPFDVTGLGSYLAFALAGIVLGGVAEELVFRGYAFRRLEAALAGTGRERRRGTLWAVLLLSALFGLAHLYQGWTGAVEITLVGLALFGVYLAAKRDLGVVIVAHATVDVVGFWLLWKSTS